MGDDIVQAAKDVLAHRETIIKILIDNAYSWSPVAAVSDALDALEEAVREYEAARLE